MKRKFFSANVLLAIAILGTTLLACDLGNVVQISFGNPTPTSAGAVAPVFATLTAAAQPTQQVIVTPTVPPRVSVTPLPVGTPDPSILVVAAAPLCEKAFTNPVPALANLPAPEAPILTLFNKEYEGRNWIYNPITSIRYATDANNVRSLLCIVETRKQTDKYPDGSPIYQVTWEARFLRWPDGQILRASAKMDGGTANVQFPKPAGTEFYGGRPDPALLEFVKLATGS